VQAQIINLMKDLQRQLALSYLFISHDLAVVHHTSDYLGVMYLGRLVEWGPAREVFQMPQHPLHPHAAGCDPGSRDERAAPDPGGGRGAEPDHSAVGLSFPPVLPVDQRALPYRDAAADRRRLGRRRCHAVEEGRLHEQATRRELAQRS
jgi:peptide/nickel transport system ATP-binding protein